MVVFILLPLNVSAQDVQTATVRRVVGIASLEVTYEGNEETVRIASVCNEEDLRQTLESNQVAGVSKTDIKRFLDNRAVTINFLRTLMPPGTRVQFRRLRRNTTSDVCEGMAYHPGWKSSGYINLESVVLSRGFSLPPPHVWDVVPDDNEMPPDYFAAAYFRAAREFGDGLWADGKRKRPGFRPYQLPRDIDPRLVVPLMLLTTSNPVTMICGSEQDVGRVTGAARDIERTLRDHLSSLRDTDLINTDTAHELEKVLLERVRTMEAWGGRPPNLTRVQLRNVRLPDPLPEPASSPSEVDRRTAR